MGYRDIQMPETQSAQHQVSATIINPSEGSPEISFRQLPFEPVTPAQARHIARQIIQASNAGDSGEVGTYPQGGYESGVAAGRPIHRYQAKRSA
jgi:hypothetical protein